MSTVFINKECRVKIGDFTHAVQLESEKERRFSFCGRLDGMSPEMIHKDNFDGHSFGTDIWAVGVITVLLITGKHPFYSTVVPKIHERICTGLYHITLDNEMSLNARNFVRAIFSVDPEFRISILGLMKHPFLQDERCKELDVELLYDKNSKKLALLS